MRGLRVIERHRMQVGLCFCLGVQVSSEWIAHEGECKKRIPGIFKQSFFYYYYYYYFIFIFLILFDFCWLPMVAFFPSVAFRVFFLPSFSFHSSFYSSTFFSGFLLLFRRLSRDPQEASRYAFIFDKLRFSLLSRTIVVIK